MKKILFVEDDLAIAKSLSYKLQQAKFKVITINNGAQASEVLKKIKPDLALLDLILPGKSGLEILKEIKSSSSLKNIPIILFTNISDQTKIAEAMALGSFDYIIKSDFSLDQIVEKIKKKLNAA